MTQNKCILLSLFQIAVTILEHYPTHLIMKTLPKIDRKRRYLREAYKFIKREKVRTTNKWTVIRFILIFLYLLLFQIKFQLFFFADILAKYQRRNHFNALFIQSKAYKRGWGHADYYFVARFTRGFSTGYQTVDNTVFNEVEHRSHSQSYTSNHLWNFNSISIICIYGQLHGTMETIRIRNGFKSNRISNCHDTRTSAMEMQLSIGKQSSWSNFNGDSSGFTGHESSLVWIVSVKCLINFWIFSSELMVRSFSHRYDNVIVFDTSKCYEHKIPMHFDVMTQMVHNCCLTARNVSTNTLHLHFVQIFWICINFCCFENFQSTENLIGAVSTNTIHNVHYLEPKYMCIAHLKVSKLKNCCCIDISCAFLPVTLSFLFCFSHCLHNKICTYIKQTPLRVPKGEWTRGNARNVSKIQNACTHSWQFRAENGVCLFKFLA